MGRRASPGDFQISLNLDNIIQLIHKYSEMKLNVWEKNEKLLYLWEDSSALIGDLCNVATISIDGVGHLIF